MSAPEGMDADAHLYRALVLAEMLAGYDHSRGPLKDCPRPANEVAILIGDHLLEARRLLAEKPD